MVSRKHAAAILLRQEEAAMFKSIRKEPSRELVPVDDVVGNLPFIVRRDHRIVAAFARKAAAEEWAQLRSWNDESRFTVHTAAEVLFGFQDGEEAP
jgi:hypothetical protein